MNTSRQKIPQEFYTVFHLTSIPSHEVGVMRPRSSCRTENKQLPLEVSDICSFTKTRVTYSRTAKNDGPRVQGPRVSAPESYTLLVESKVLGRMCSISV